MAAQAVDYLSDGDVEAAGRIFQSLLHAESFLAPHNLLLMQVRVGLAEVRFLCHTTSIVHDTKWKVAAQLRDIAAFVKFNQLAWETAQFALPENHPT